MNFGKMHSHVDVELRDNTYRKAPYYMAKRKILSPAGKRMYFFPRLVNVLLKIVKIRYTFWRSIKENISEVFITIVYFRIVKHLFNIVIYRHCFFANVIDSFN